MALASPEEAGPPCASFCSKRRAGSPDFPDKSMSDAGELFSRPRNVPPSLVALKRFGSSGNSGCSPPSEGSCEGGPTLKGAGHPQSGNGTIQNAGNANEHDRYYDKRPPETHPTRSCDCQLHSAVSLASANSEPYRAHLLAARRHSAKESTSAPSGEKERLAPTR